MTDQTENEGEEPIDRSVLDRPVRDLMTSPVRTVEADLSVQTAAQILVGDEIGALVVADEARDDEIEGIVTETDVVEAVAADHDTRRMTVVELMTPSVVTVEADRSVEIASDRMRAEGIKKLPVTDGDDLVGIFTTTDVTHALVADLDDIVLAFND